MTPRERAALATVLTGVVASAVAGDAHGPMIFGVALTTGIVIGFIFGVSFMAYLGSEQRRIL